MEPNNSLIKITIHFKDDKTQTESIQNFPESFKDFEEDVKSLFNLKEIKNFEPEINGEKTDSDKYEEFFDSYEEGTEANVKILLPDVEKPKSIEEIDDPEELQKYIDEQNKLQEDLENEIKDLEEEEKEIEEDDTMPELNVKEILKGIDDVIKKKFKQMEKDFDNTFNEEIKKVEENLEKSQEEMNNSIQKLIEEKANNVKKLKIKGGNVNVDDIKRKVNDIKSSLDDAKEGIKLMDKVDIDEDYVRQLFEGGDQPIEDDYGNNGDDFGNNQNNDDNDYD